MNEELLKQKFIEIIKSKDYLKIKTNLSLEERIFLIKNDFFELDDLDDISEAQLITMFLTEQEAKDLLPQLGQNNLLDIFILAALPDIEKEKILNSKNTILEDEENKRYLIKFLENDELKMKYLLEVQDEFSKREIMISFQNDKLKLKNLELLTDEYSKEAVIKSLKSDEQKLESLNLLTDEYSKVAVIKSLKSDEQKLESLNLLTDEDSQIEVIETIQSDESKIQGIKNTNDETVKYHLIKTLSTDELKLEYLNEISFGFIRSVLINQFKKESLKIEALKQLTEEDDKADVIRYLSNDLLKMEWLITLKAEEAKCRIIRSLENDELKIECLTNLTSELQKMSVIRSLKSDELKINYLGLLEDEYKKMLVIKSLSNDDLKIQGLNKFPNERYKVEIIMQLKNDELCLKTLSSITDITNIKQVIDHKELHEEVPIPMEIIQKYSESYSVDILRLNILVQKFSYKLLRVIEEEEIKKVFLLEEEEFQKYLSIFDKKNVDTKQNESIIILESIFKKEFKKAVSEVDRIFPLLEILIEQKQYDKIKQILEDIDKTVPLKNYIKDNLDNFILDLTNIETKNTLHEITNEYIEIKKNEYANARLKNIVDSDDSNDITTVRNFRYDKGFITKKVIATTSIEKLLILIRNIPSHLLTKQELNLVNNKDLLTEIIKFKKSPNQYGDISEIKPYLKSFERLFTVLYDEDKLQDPTNDINAKRTLMPKKVSKEFLISIMAEIDVDKLRDKVFSDDLMYNQLLTILNKYKLLGIGSTYDSLFEKINTECNNVTLAALISSFPIINKKLEKDIKEEKITGKSLFNYIVYANTYGSETELYSKLFGKENYVLISTDKGPNTSGKGAKMRLPKAVECIKEMYKREYVTVPSMDTIIELKNKKMNIVVGNVTNMINLTYGERTGACMRIGGAGSTLFDFCRNNKNGFHIRFTDPDTKEFVSRVSGFRNGNTVFLNQLRHSVSEKYSNEEVVNFCKEVAKLLVQNSMNSQYPIKNVVISPGYAMSPHSSEKQNLEVSNIKEGMENFYSDINSENAILLTSSNQDGKLVPIELGPDKVERYTPQRDKVQLVENEEEIIEKIARIQMIDQLLENITLENCIYNVPENLEKCYVGEDWYVAIDTLGNIYSQMMKNSSHQEKALEEINILKEALGLQTKEELEDNDETQKRI